MTRARVCTLATAALLLELLPLAAAHGDEHKDESADIDHGAPHSYWSLSEHASLMYWHIALEILAWVAVLPVGTFWLDCACETPLTLEKV